MQLMHGDCLDRLRGMPDNSVDSIVTDPPYGLSFMGKRWDYDVPAVEVWAECLRVLKPGGHLLAFAGTRTQHRMAVRIEDAGFEIRDMIAWVYGSGFNKVGYIKDGGGQHVRKGWGGSLKPALEPITMARKPFASTVAANVLKWGTGALNIDGCRVDAGDGRPLIESKSEASLNAFGNGLNGSRSAGVTTQGRWPANLIHSGEPEVVAGFPQTGPSKAAPSGSVQRYDPADASAKRPKGGNEVRGIDDSGGSAARFFYCAKASKKDRDEGMDGFELNYVARENGFSDKLSDTKKPRANNHPTVKPSDLMAYLCRLVTPPGGIVLDPFMGSGSTGKAAMREGFDFIGIEKDAGYFAIAQKRIEQAQQQLFAGVAA